MTKFKKAAINVATIIAVAATVGTSITLVGCDSPFAKNEVKEGAGTATPERKAGDAKYNDGDYVFYFKDGSRIHGDCDGYNSDPNGVTTIYEWHILDANKWEKRLKGIGIKPEKFITARMIHCWVRFPTSLLKGVGWEGNGSINITHTPNADILTNSGSKINFIADYMHYARAHEGFSITHYSSQTKDYEGFVDIIRDERRENREYPSILFGFFGSERGTNQNNAMNALKSAGITIEVADHGGGSEYRGFTYIIVNANNVKWFAFDL
ncbi:hypothetical protein [Treponema endosymbiont of Eucomonympha sp.]|uniref:hypothetical protein n=1 Tax=Treponema endosymbiont of Eucomonympha sp. TaxID=1580831 RepID=UPI00078382DC|nr:hypothetical protein [Treponema endosymbiont of Eucomonympha sp.]